MKKYIALLIGALALGNGCTSDRDFLDVKPTTILLLDDVYGDPRLVLSVVTDLYNRIPDLVKPSNPGLYAGFDYAFASGDYGRHQFRDYSFDDWNYWDYGYIREINLFIQRVGAATKLTPADQAQFAAEAGTCGPTRTSSWRNGWGAYRSLRNR